MPSSFLEDLEQIAVRSYQATDDDIMRTCLRHSGIKGYRMVFEKGTPPPLPRNVRDFRLIGCSADR